MTVSITTVSGPTVSVSGVVEYNVQVEVNNSPTITISPIGTQGPPGVGGTISTDAGNVLVRGSDDGLFVPEPITSDGGVDLTLLFNNQLI